jgi:hypothetical protein
VIEQLESSAFPAVAALIQTEQVKSAANKVDQLIPGY